MDQEDKLSIGNVVDPRLLHKIDKLFACGVGEYVALPQLIVVGDQSSGKSSVLEGLTALPFPRDSGLCTRFATQITFRRTPLETITVSLIPSKHAKPDHVEKARAWKKEKLVNFDANVFADIMKEAQEIMGLGVKADDGGLNSFSEDVLKLEVCGPAQQHYSVVDVPGIFRIATKGVTTLDDANMVKSMVRRYMENPRSIMLTVIPANVDIATQEILTMAEEVDDDGHRTLGVLTKPDLVDTGAEENVMKLMHGEKHPLSLGWCLVKNPGQQQLHMAGNGRLLAEDAFFRDKAPWNTLDKDRVGVAALRVRLQEVLADNIRREFPKVKSEILKKLQKSQAELEHLGVKRETREEQSSYLLALSMHFQETVSLALSADYSRSDAFNKIDSLRFATCIIARNDMLTSTMEKHGHSYAFDVDTGNKKEEAPKVEEKKKKKKEEEEVSSTGESKKTHSDGYSNMKTLKPVVPLRLTEDHENLDEIHTHQNDTVKDAVERNMAAWLTQVYKQSRGFELGTFDSKLLAKMMKAQSSKWEDISICYIMDIINMAHNFTCDLLEQVCPDQRVRAGLLLVLHDQLICKYKNALKHAHFLLEVERQGTPATQNPYFNDNLEKARQGRLQAKLKKKVQIDTSIGPYIPFSEVVLSHSMSNLEHIVTDMHDILKAYYEVARKRFVDNLCMQAADYHLVTGPDAPLKLFSPTFVAALTEEQLAEIASEDPTLKRRRAALTKMVQDLQVGKRLLGMGG